MQISPAYTDFDPNYFKHIGPITGKAGTLADLFRLWLRRSDPDGLLKLWNSRINYKRALTGPPPLSPTTHLFKRTETNLGKATKCWYRSKLPQIFFDVTTSLPQETVVTWYDICKNSALLELYSRGVFLERKSIDCPYTTYALTDPTGPRTKVKDFDWLDLADITWKEEKQIATLYRYFTEIRMKQAASLLP